MMDPLKVPKALPRPGIERKQSVCEEIVAYPVCSVKVEDCRPGRHIDDAALFVQRHPRPVVRCARSFPRVGRPGGVAEFARMRDGVKSPAKTAGANIESANVARRRRIRLRIAATNDNQILVNDAWCGEGDGLKKIVSPQALPQIDSSLLAKRGNHFAGRRIERIKIVHHSSQNAAMLAVAPIGKPTRRLGAVYPGVKFPQQLTVGGVKRNHLLRRGVGKQSPPYNDRACLQSALFGSIELPCFFEPLYVATIDLR